jgi:hypothetical protein
MKAKFPPEYLMFRLLGRMYRKLLPKDKAEMEVFTQISAAK